MGTDKAGGVGKDTGGYQFLIVYGETASRRACAGDLQYYRSPFYGPATPPLTTWHLTRLVIGYLPLITQTITMSNDSLHLETIAPIGATNWNEAVMARSITKAMSSSSVLSDSPGCEIVPDSQEPTGKYESGLMILPLSTPQKSELVSVAQALQLEVKLLSKDAAVILTKLRDESRWANDRDRSLRAMAASISGISKELTVVANFMSKDETVISSPRLLSSTGRAGVGNPVTRKKNGPMPTGSRPMRKGTYGGRSMKARPPSF